MNGLKKTVKTRKRPEISVRPSGDFKTIDLYEERKEKDKYKRKGKKQKVKTKYLRKWGLTDGDPPRRAIWEKEGF